MYVSLPVCTYMHVCFYVCRCRVYKYTTHIAHIFHQKNTEIILIKPPSRQLALRHKYLPKNYCKLPVSIWPGRTLVHHRYCTLCLHRPTDADLKLAQSPKKLARIRALPWSIRLFSYIPIANILHIRSPTRCIYRIPKIDIYM